MGGGADRARVAPPLPPLPPPPLPANKRFDAPPLPLPPPLPAPPSQCLGFAASTGRRCRIKWDLNAFGFCTYHASQQQQHQAPPLSPLPPVPCDPPPPRKPVKVPPRTCAGTTKQGLPCKIAWQLDALGYCKYHTQLTRECRGVARSTGQRCRIRWDLDANGYCQHHSAQAEAADKPSTPSQCVALARSTGQRCRIATGLDASGLCSVHQRAGRAPVATAAAATTVRSPGKRICAGVVFLTGEPCTNDAKRDYAYCCAAHDPALRYFSPRLFDAGDRPRSLLEPQVVRRYDGRDLYHGDLLDLVTPGAVELDHILEKQCFAFAFHGVPFEDVASDAAYLAAVVRDQFANELDNVCLTRTTTNKIKGSAVWKFLDDTITGHVESPSSGAAAAGIRSRVTFTDYMLAEKRDDARLERTTTRVITREMGRALKACQRTLADQGETPLVDALSEQLQDVYVKMDLRSASQHTSSKYDAAARPTQRDPPQDERRRREKPKARSEKPTLADSVHAKPFVPAQAKASPQAATTVGDDEVPTEPATSDAAESGERVDSSPGSSVDAEETHTNR